jgi:hypothetical protein
MTRNATTLAALLAATIALPALAAPVDGALLNRISDAGLNHGEVVDTAAWLADRIGGRMTNSPAMRVAEAWTQERFSAWGLKNVHREGFDFGRGWWIESAAARMVAPRPLALRSIPVAWTPATHGALVAPIIVAPLRTEQDFAAWRGKLKGRIVLVSWPAPPQDETEAPFKRLVEADIAKSNHFSLPNHDPESLAKSVERFTFHRKVDAFLAAEGAVAWATMSRSEGHLVHGEGYDFQRGRTPRLPGIEIAAEDYRRLARLAKSGDVRLEIDSRVHFEDGDPQAYNIFAEIPGRDPAAGYVMAGAHLDSWVAGDGAADNGAGSAVIMEAARILASLGLQPQRTIRFALWAGEEQGLLGSGAYVAQHLVKRPPPKDPALAELGPFFAGETWPIEPLPGYQELAAYFNIDNGSGKVRGLYTEGNLAVATTLRDWLAPFAGMDATSVVAAPTGGTDHVFLSRIGLPAFQFIQDPLDYGSRVHHTDLDTFDHLRPDDLRQASVILAAVLLDAANSEQALGRKPLPTEPKPTDPFKYAEPSKP